MKQWKRVVTAVLCGVLAIGSCQGGMTAKVQGEEIIDTGNSGSETGMISGEMLEGNSSDISISGVSISGEKAGGKVTIQFTVSGNKNNKKKYEVDTIERVYPVLDNSFPFVMNDEAYRVTSGNGNSVQCSYSFKAKDNLETAYYLTGFTVVYGRKSTDGNITAYDNEYYVNKNISVKLTAKKNTATSENAADTTAQDGDVSLKMRNNPSGIYGGSCQFAFTVYSSEYLITSVVPVINDSFPFESTSDAYKVIRSKGRKQLNCNYYFQVKKDVTTGYHPVSFQISYKKNGVSATATKLINVHLQGKKKGKTVAAGKKSTPRVMVTGYKTDVKNITPNSKFNLTLQITNNASKEVRNVKFTLSTANGEFLPVSGASTAYVDRITAKQTVNIVFQMKASAGLGAKSYPITVKAEYEDTDVQSFESQDNVSIPVTLEDRISLTEVMPPDMLSVGGTGDLSFSINNMGKGSLNNVTVKCKGEGIDCEESFVGNIAAGATGYANVTIYGNEITPEDSEGECTIVIKYENSSGESRVYKEKTYLYVMEESFDDMEMMDEELMEMEGEAQSGFFKPVMLLGLLAVVIVVIVIISRIRRKKRLKKEEELMEDELL